MIKPPLHTIYNDSCRSFGGLTQIALVLPEDLSGEPEWGLLPSIADDDIIFRPGRASYGFAFDTKSASFTGQSQTDNDAGDSITYRVRALHKGHKLEVDYLQAKLMNRRIHVFLTNAAGQKRILPYARCSFEFDSGSKPGQAPGYTFSAQLALDKPAPYWGGALTIVGGTLPPSPPVVLPGVDVDTQQVSTSNSTLTITVDSAKLLAFVGVKGTAAQNVSLGSTPGSMDRGYAEASAGQQITFSVGQQIETTTMFYLSGLAGTNTVTIWLLSRS